MKLITTILTSIICLLFLAVHAQPVAGNGCMTTTSPNRVYQQALANYNGLPTYKGYSAQYSEWTPQADMSTYPCFTWNQTSSNGCYIKTGSGNSSSKYKLGNYGNFTGSAATSCPIDDYIFPFAMLMATLAYFHIKRRPFQSFLE